MPEGVESEDDEVLIAIQMRIFQDDITLFRGEDDDPITMLDSDDNVKC